MPPSPPASPIFPRPASGLGEGWDKDRPRARTVASRVLTGAVLVLAGAVAGLAAGQTMATRSAHQTGACAALNMAAALGYLDAEQQRRVRHALATAINPDVDLFLGNRASLRETCNAAP